MVASGEPANGQPSQQLGKELLQGSTIQKSWQKQWPLPRPNVFDYSWGKVKGIIGISGSLTTEEDRHCRTIYKDQQKFRP